MVRTVILETLSQWLVPALPAGNSFASEWTVYGPSATPNPQNQDGFNALPLGPTVQANRLHILPYAAGPAGSQFSMRVYGWKLHAIGYASGASKLFIPYFLAEFACVTCDPPGPNDPTPPGTPTMRPIQPTERFCDTITLTQGDLGQAGWINATGTPANVNQNGVTTGLIGYIMLELQGCQQFSFDFKQTADPGVGMNAVYSKA